MQKKTRKIVTAVIVCAAAAVLGGVIYVRTRVTQVSVSKQVVQALSDTSSLHSVDTIDFTGSTTQQGMRFGVALQAVDDNKVSTDPAAAYSERTVDITLMGSGTSQKNYIYVDGDTGTMYASTDGKQWYSQTASGTEYSIRSQTMEAFFEEVADGTQEAELVKGYDAGTAGTASGSSEYAASEEPAVTEEAAASYETAETAAPAENSFADDEVYTLTADVSGDLLKEMMTGMLTSIEGATSNRYDAVDWDKVTAQVRAYVDKDTKLPVRITVDCPQLGSRIMRSSTGGSGSTSLTCRTFSVRVDLDGYDETKVDIPSEIKNDAQVLIGGTDEEAAASATTGSAPSETAPEKEP